MHYKLAQLKQRMGVKDRPVEEPVDNDDSGLAAAISQLVQREVSKQTAVAKQPAQERLQNIDRQLTEHANESIPWQKEFGAKPSNDWPAPPATTPLPKAPITVSLMRDGAGKVIGTTVGELEFRIDRDAAGVALQMTQIEKEA